MAYVNYYRLYFSNNLNESIVIDIQRKDGNPLWVVETLTESVVEFKINAEADGDGLFAPVIRKNIELVLNLTDVHTVTWETFFDQVHDEWRVLVTNDTQDIFTGFMLPDEGNVPFEDKPYDLTIRAVDGLGLLKNEPLKKPDGTNFKGKFTLIEYIAACLYWTRLELPIKIHCDIYESSMNDRSVGIHHDMFAQAKLDHRTFMKDAVEFVSCFEAIEIIFKEHFRIHQDYDKQANRQVWCIDRIAQYQYTPAPIYYFTLYDFEGLNPVGWEEHENYAEIGKTKLIYKTNDVSRSGKFAVKKTRTSYAYKVWPELPLNSKFERGTLIPLLSGPNYTSFTIDDWEFGMTNADVNSSAFDYPFPLVATTKRAYRKSTYNIYGTEIEREIIIERPQIGGTLTGARANWLRSEGIPVNMGDKVKLGFDVKYLVNVASLAVHSTIPAHMYIVGDDNNIYGLSGTNWIAMPISGGVTLVGTIGADFNTQDSKQYSGVSVDAPVIPANGVLYVALSYLANQQYGTQVFFRNFVMEYKPFVAGGYIEVKGDYWETSQNRNFIDVTANEIPISDTVIRVLKGCFFRANGTVATTPTWYRYGLTESKHYKQLVNIGRYNTEYRRFFKFQGTFTSTKFCPENDPTRIQPISFRKTYKMVDLPEEPECVLVAPFTIDYKTGWITAIFEEVRRESETPIPETLEDFMVRMVAAINSTTEAEWTSGGGAPASGTSSFPPIAGIWAGVPNTIAIAINSVDMMSATYTIGAAGNAPWVMETSNINYGVYRHMLFEFGPDIAIGNTFIFSAYGYDVALTVGSTLNNSNDGRQTGDSSTFNYLFE